MAWNRPQADTQAKDSLRRAGTARPTKAVRGLLCAAIFVVVAAVVAWWLLPNATAPVAEDGYGTVERRIREVKPATARTNDTAATTPSSPKELPPQHVDEVRNGHILLSTGELYPVKSVVRIKAKPTTLVTQVFTNSSDQLIGSLLMLEPGDSMIGNSEDLYANFNNYFVESLKSDIVVNADDPMDVLELKRAVLDVRAELKDRR